MFSLPSEFHHVFMIGGPNGAGKTTAAFTLLPRFLQVFEFVNADEIARGISPLNPENVSVPAARVMIKRLEELTKEHKNFAFETTCSGYGHINTLKRCKKAGYLAHGLFVFLPSAGHAVERVKKRVSLGGHSIPEEVIHRRYAKGIAHFVNDYLPLLDSVLVYDNSEENTPFSEQKIIARKEPEGIINIHNSPRWNQLQEVARHAEN